MSYDYGVTSDIVDYNKLIKLKFSPNEISFLIQFINTYGQVTTSKIVGFTRLSEGGARKIKYMYDICTGKITIDTPDELSKHLKKMSGGKRRIGIQDLAVSKIQRVPRKALVAGIPNGPFAIYNSNRYSENERMYNVVDVTGSNIILRTDRKPILKHGESKKIEGILEIRNINTDGTVDIAISKTNSRLCNRFMVVASLRSPEFHHGMVEIIAGEGTRVYVFNQTMGDSETPSYRNGTQRVYDYGFTKQELCPKLMAVAKVMYKYVGGMYSCVEKPNSDFTLFKRVEKQESEEMQIE